MPLPQKELGAFPAGYPSCCYPKMVSGDSKKYQWPQNALHGEVKSPMHLSVKIRVNPCPAFSSHYHIFTCKDLLDARDSPQMFPADPMSGGLSVGLPSLTRTKEGCWDRRQESCLAPLRGPWENCDQSASHPGPAGRARLVAEGRALQTTGCDLHREFSRGSMSLNCHTGP